MSDQEYSQENRIAKIKTTLGETELLLEKFVIEETLSKLFEAKLTMLSTNYEVDIKSLLRTNATITIKLQDGTPRYFHGVFRSLKQARSGARKGESDPRRDLSVYEAVLVPKPWLLSLDQNCKVFQNMSVTDIVGKVLKDSGYSDYAFRTQGTYPQRDYCIQYRESSMAFISRLLEEEGIFYFFEHTDSKHTMVFADQSSVQGTCPNQATAEYSLDQSGWVEDGKEGVSTLERLEAAFTGKGALTDYNFETPSLNLLGNLGSDNEEAFDYPGEYGTVDDGSRYTRIRLEERESEQFVLTGTSRCRAFRPGFNFKLKGHHRDDNNKDYFLTSVVHEALESSYRQDKSADVSQYYFNTFKAIPKTVPYRPPRHTPRPKVHGLQPAVVVGKSGEEIWVDKYGRVKVQFFWDRLGKKNETSSCWVRVSQIWAGKNWGWMTIPRIGQEVLVDFLEGDPDYPVIVGRVYNADQMPPYSLPDNQTQSGIKSRSSKGGGGSNYNEIRFEDLSGSEKITVWAEKDMDTTVEHDDTQHVQNDRTIKVDGKHTETIVKDTSITITQGNHSLEIQQGNQSIKLDQGNQTTELSMGNQSIKLSLGNQSTDVSLGKVDTTAMQSITLTVGGSSIKIDQMGVTIQGMMIKISGNVMTDVEGSAMLTLKGGITMIN